MASELYEKGKIRLVYSKSKVKKAGETIRKAEVSQEAVMILQNYRAAHLYPLTIIKNLVWKNLKQCAPDAIIARRLKRLPTIIDKLKRKTLDGSTNNAICLTRMQDIGGCRVIVADKEQLILINSRMDASRNVHSSKVTDYNKNPKPSGYRGIHRVYKCYDKLEKHDWKGFSIELQLRTKLQHLWATTVEIVDLCEGLTLKTNPSNSNSFWVSFFCEMSDFLADEETFIYLTNEQKNKKKNKLIFLDRELNAIQKLRSFNSIFSNKFIIELHRKNRYAIIAINRKEEKTYYQFFRENQKIEAIKLYGQLESDAGWNGLFVEMDDLRQLELAYPNYLIDTRLFINKFKEYTESSYWTNPSRNRKSSL
ncbi:RelA/SpoT domain-containing protein [Morganella morganii]|uniref:RelA/SpoT domain-containing protein n=1 Tax=Morganella morganii TaxID=582 RepID=UPI00046919B2|nr:RelA/SpoT domain-containing protein [Morganella morganii]